MILEKDVVLFNGLREGVCGHIFECIDYYLFFKSRGLSCGVYLVYDNLDKDKYEKIIENKYNLTKDEIAYLVSDTIIESNREFYSKKVYNFSKVKNFIFTEIHDFARIDIAKGPILGINEIIGLRCGLEEEAFRRIALKKFNIKIFQDFRIYGESLQHWPTYNHKKRLYVDRYKRPTALKENTAFVYLSTDCRNSSRDYIEDIIKTHSDKMCHIYFSVKDPSEHLDLANAKTSFLIPPLDDFVNIFDTFIYVPIERKFDCSPRLVAESYLFGKKIIYHNIGGSYFEQDRGLYWRNFDCTNNLEDLNLTSNDSLVEYIMGKV